MEVHQVCVYGGGGGCCARVHVCLHTLYYVSGYTLQWSVDIIGSEGRSCKRSRIINTHTNFAKPVMLYEIAKAKFKALKYKKSKHEANNQTWWCGLGTHRRV